MRMLSMSGIVLTIIGFIKIWLFAQSQGQILIPTCLGEQFVIDLKAPTPHFIHCWGCYLSLFGIGLIAMDGFKYFCKRPILPTSLLYTQNILPKVTIHDI